ncbi:hypothetical protein HHK36_010508 [Tetracentron sinense]|uniref:Uncharacterized protein n=1 Tax=Tetracentron sinense TaxID=13715 RepID=A0A835DJA7_TETSI|nr:hypothetical protein HHK36_010508 [Tetracentron sinense]
MSEAPVTTNQRRTVTNKDLHILHMGELCFPEQMYTAFGPEYVYPQGLYSPYVGQQYLQVYGVPGTVNTGIYPYGQLGQTLPGSHGYTTVQGYAMPGHHIVQFAGPNANGLTTATIPSIQAPYPTGKNFLLGTIHLSLLHVDLIRQIFWALSGIAAPIPGQPQFIVPAHSPQFTQGSGSDQTAG